MIIFKSLRWKNFLSTGNNWCSINLVEDKHTLIVGQNGSGKSTILDALSFSLFGKAHRKITKPQLVNSVNNKDCCVEVEFEALGQNFKIIRGIKPNKFEIWKSGVMIDQSSHTKEYQKILEQNILKLNHKSFHQIVVLGSSSFIPFMQLSTPNRREVIEDLLDINVFSKMNTILKEKQSLLKDEITDAIHQHGIVTTKIDAQKKYIKDIAAINKGQRQEKLKFISDRKDEIEALHRKNEKLNSSIQSELPNTVEQRGQCEAEIKKLETKKTRVNTEVQKLVKDVQFFENNTTCPTCDQAISEETKTVHILDGKSKAKKLQARISTANDGIQTAQSALSTINEIIDRCKEYQTQLTINNNSINQIQLSITRTQDDISKLDDSVDLEESNNTLNKMISASQALVEMKLNLNEQFNYNMIIGEMLKDSGIKTKIVREYIPIINKLVNMHLKVLDFFVSFHLDESFSEVIKSRHRDTFSYESFSEGEKQRIDLALLFTWRMIAKMKNSVSTNLLILDETFDSSLDHDGVDNLMKIIYSLDDDTNVFVISHKGELLENRFDKKLEVVRKKNFSKIT